MNTFNLSIGQAVDAMLSGKTIVRFTGDELHFNPTRQMVVDQRGMRMEVELLIGETFKLKGPPIEMETRYRPLEFKLPHTSVWSSNVFYGSKSEFFKDYPNGRVSEWEEKEFIKNWEDWPNEK